MKELAQRIATYWPELDALASTGSSDVVARPILNYGGFVNRSFEVSDGARRYHVKLSSDPYSVSCLRRWSRLAGPLSKQYRAPALRGWLDVPDTPFSGPVFDWIEGAAPEAVDGASRNAVVEAVGRMHADAWLAEAMRELGDEVRSCARAYADTYHERFVEDLRIVRAEPPAFVRPELLDWMDEQVDRLERAVNASVAFAGPAAVASHRDLWLDNLMVTAEGDVFILDWDEMGLGDEMMDWAMLFGPSRARVRAAHEQDLPEIAFSPEQRERWALYARASILDWIIDPLADWVDAAREQEHGPAVRASNRRVFEEALRCYADLYGIVPPGPVR